MPEDELIPTRRSLLTRLKDWEDRDGWKEFFDTYWRLIYGVALKSGLSEVESEEVVQETILAVAKQMPTFQYDAKGSFKGWLLQITRRRIVDQFRKRQPWDMAAPADTISSGTPAAERIPGEELDLEPLWDVEWRQNLMTSALDRVKARIAPRQYQIFDLYVLKEWPVRDVTRTLNVSAARVYLTKHRVSGLVQEELRRLERQFAATEGRKPEDNDSPKA